MTDSGPTWAWHRACERGDPCHRCAHLHPAFDIGARDRRAEVRRRGPLLGVLPDARNPYPAGTVEYLCWQRGYENAS